MSTEAPAVPQATLPPIEFCSRGAAYYEFSNFYSAPFTVDGLWYQHTEGYFHAQKFPGNPALCEKIRLAESPAEAKRLGRLRDPGFRRDWDLVRIEAMQRALRAKFTQHPVLRQLLLLTGDRLLVEANGRDSFWGWGPAPHRGQNQLGKLLVALRQELRLEEAAERVWRQQEEEMRAAATAAAASL